MKSISHKAYFNSITSHSSRTRIPTATTKFYLLSLPLTHSESTAWHEIKETVRGYTDMFTPQVVKAMHFAGFSRHNFITHLVGFSHLRRAPIRIALFHIYICIQHLRPRAVCTKTSQKNRYVYPSNFLSSYLLKYNQIPQIIPPNTPQEACPMQRCPTSSHHL